MRPQFIGRTFIVFLVLCLPSLSWAQKGNVGESASSLIKTLMTESQAVGIAVSVGVKGQIVWSEGFGYADVEQRVPVRPAKTRFRVGSIAKPLTTVAIAQLYEQGRLDLDAPIQRYIPTFPEKRGQITTRLLAGHLAGIRHYRDDEFLSQRNYGTVLEGLTIFQQDTLLYSPGMKFSYSSYGWNLISAVVEGASGQSFLEYMDEHVFKAISMNHTVADHVDSIRVDRGRYYHVRDGVLLNAPTVDNSYKWAGGGFLSTAEDLVRFGFAHLNKTLLKHETIQLLWTSQKTSSGKETEYGIGWRIGKDKSGRSWVGHGGGSVGGTTFFRIYPEAQVVLVIIANMSSLRYGDIPEKIAELFLTE